MNYVKLQQKWALSVVGETFWNIWHKVPGKNNPQSYCQAVSHTTSTGLVEVGLHVVTVDFGSTEDDCFVHVVHSDGTQSVLAFQHLHSLRQHLCNMSNSKYDCFNLTAITHTHAHHNHFTALFPGHPGEPVPEENFWTLWCKGRLTEADRPTIRLGATPSGLTSAHLHHPPIFLQAGCPSCRPTNSVKALKYSI